MLTSAIPTLATEWATEIETARALFSAGDYDDVLRVVGPIIDRPRVDGITRFAAFQLKACVESQRDQYERCLETLRQAGPFVDEVPPDLRGKYYGQRALAYRHLDQIDKALIDYEAARVCATEARDEQTLANVRNNLAKVYSDAGKFAEAIVEVDAAIRMATRLGDEVLLGRYYDLKAQILIDHEHYAEALTHSKKAVSLLASHPSLKEARSTHGLAMVCLGATYLGKRVDSIEEFRARHHAAKTIHVALDSTTIKRALRRSNGHLLKAARLLRVRHSVLGRLVEKHDLERVPKRRRSKTLIAK